MSGEIDESMVEYIQRMRRINLKKSLDKLISKQENEIKKSLHIKFIMDLKSLESSVETITEKGTEYTGQYIQINLIYELIDEYEEKLKQYQN